MTVPPDDPDLPDEYAEETPYRADTALDGGEDAAYAPSRRSVLQALAAGSLVPATASTGAAQDEETLELYIRTPQPESHGIEEGDDLDVYITYRDLDTKYNDIGVYASGSIPYGSVSSVKNLGAVQDSDGTLRTTISYDTLERHIEDGEVHLYAGAGCDGLTRRCVHASDPITIEQLDWEDEEAEEDDSWWSWIIDDSEDDTSNDDNGEEDDGGLLPW